MNEVYKISNLAHTIKHTTIACIYSLVVTYSSKNIIYTRGEKVQQIVAQ